MTDKQTGGDAFPRATKITSPTMVTQVVHTEGGMTLRDYFAAKAMVAFYTASYQYEFTGESKDPEHEKLLEELAEDAYQMADGMLKAREK